MALDQEQADPLGTAIILAAGASTRFGADKRSIPFGGTTLLHYTINQYSNVFHQVIVVLRKSEKLQLEHSKSNVIPVYTSIADLGISQSLRVGVQYVVQNPWLVIGLMDMPYIKESTLRSLAYRMDETAASVVRLTYQQQYGNPVGFKRECFSQLCELSGDQGARSLIDSGSLSIEELEVDDRGILMDLDTPEQLQDYGDPSHRDS